MDSLSTRFSSFFFFCLRIDISMDCGKCREIVSREHMEIRLLLVIKGIIAGQKNRVWAGTSTAKLRSKYIPWG